MSRIITVADIVEAQKKLDFSIKGTREEIDERDLAMLRAWADYRANDRDAD
ncbi:MAG: hypothetical protein VKL39_24120 [Leptolyngbyaceae bacterium]|nr:hypothetical protein [Leptolyngbyaceae bacterium]